MAQNNPPPIGMADWLLTGGSRIDRIAWLIENGFQGISFLQNIMDIDPSERIDVAAAISEADLYVTYHGNVHDHLKKTGELDLDFASRMFDDVIWWHENTNGVYSCGSDSINALQPDGSAIFDFNLNRDHINLMASRLCKYGIRVGIENSFGGKDKFCTTNDSVCIKELCSEYPIGMLLDTGHMNIHLQSDNTQNEDSVSNYISNLPLEIFEVHFSDNFGKKDEHKQLGYGNLNLDNLFDSLKQIKFNGKFTIEVCVDILSGKYFSDIHDSSQMEALLISKDKIKTAWATATARATRYC